MVKKSGLGKGLSALIPTNKESVDPTDQYAEIPLSLLDPNPEQPRHTFHEGQLNELSESIKHNGVIQPIIVTPMGERYVVIAGERRWRATTLAGYPKIPAIVRKVEKGQMLSIALLENIQRQELNPIEEALAYSKLLESNNLTQDVLAERLGKNRVTISNTIRLLKLPMAVKNMVQDGKISFGHARCLVTIDEPDKLMKLANNCTEKRWSVRELENRIKQERDSKSRPARIKKTENLKTAEKNLTRIFQSKVSIAGDGKQGKIAITYQSEKELERLLLYLSNEVTEN